MKNTVRGVDEHPLGELVRQLLAAYGLDDKLTEVRLKKAWYTLLGPMGEKYTTKVRIKDKVMFVSLSSAALRYELTLSRETLMKSLHKEAGVSDYLRDIVIR